MAGSCGAYCAFCGKCGRDLSLGLPADIPKDVAPPGVCDKSHKSAATNNLKKDFDKDFSRGKFIGERLSGNLEVSD